jgi:hypothetical protein
MGDALFRVGHVKTFSLRTIKPTATSGRGDNSPLLTKNGGEEVYICSCGNFSALLAWNI